MNIFKYFIGIPCFRVFRSNIIPGDHIIPLEGPDAVLKRMYLTHYKENIIDDSMGTIDMVVKFKPEIIFELAGLKGFLLVFGHRSRTSRIKVTIEMSYDSFKVRLSRGLRLRFPREWLCPVKRSFGKWKIGNRHEYTEILIDKTVVIDQDWNIYFDGENEYFFGPAVVSGTDIVLEAAAVGGA